VSRLISSRILKVTLRNAVLRRSRRMSVGDLVNEQKKAAYARRKRRQKAKALGIPPDGNLGERIDLLLEAIMERDDLYGFDGVQEVTPEEYESLLAVFAGSASLRPEQVRVAKFALATRGF